MLIHLDRLTHLAGLISGRSTVGVELCIADSAQLEDVSHGLLHRIVNRMLARCPSRDLRNSGHAMDATADRYPRLAFEQVRAGRRAQQHRWSAAARPRPKYVAGSGAASFDGRRNPRESTTMSLQTTEPVRLFATTPRLPAGVSFLVRTSGVPEISAVGSVYRRNVACTRPRSDRRVSGPDGA